MNKILTLFTILTFASLANAQVSTLPEKAKLLIEYHDKAIENPKSKKYCRLFFETYPNTWKEFHSYYGFDEKYDKKNDNYGYLSGRVNVLYFFETKNCVEKKKFYTKLINVSIRGEWEADNTGFFQTELHNHIFKEPHLAVSILSKMKDKEIIDFFYFFYYAYHPPFKWIPEEIEPALKTNKRVNKLMNIGFNKAIKMSKHH